MEDINQEKMAIAGSSLIPSTSSFLKKWFISQFRNIRYYSSYGLSEKFGKHDKKPKSIQAKIYSWLYLINLYGVFH